MRSILIPILLLFALGIADAQTYKSIDDECRADLSSGNAKLALAKAMKYYDAAKHKNSSGAELPGVLNLISLCYYELGNYDSSLVHCRSALALLESISKEDRLDYAYSLNNLGYLYHLKSEFKEAEALLSNALQMFKRLGKTDNVTFADCARFNAMNYDSLGNIESAETCYSKAVDVYQKVFPQVNSRKTDIEFEAARFYFKIKKAQIAERLLESVLNSCDSAYKDNPISAGQIKYYAANYYAKKNEIDKAENLYKNAAQIFSRFGTADMTEYADCNYECGRMLANKEKYEAAQPYLKASLVNRKAILAPNDPAISNTIISLANCNEQLSQFSSAEELYKEAVEIKTKYKQSDLDVALNRLALFYYRTGNLQSAEPLFRKLADLCKSSVSIDCAKRKNDLAVYFLKTGNIAAAEPLQRESLEIYTEIFNGDSKEFASIINNMASLSSAVGNYTVAEEFFKRALEMKQRLYREDHSDLALGMNNMATAYMNSNKPELAEPLFESALGMYRRIFSYSRPETAKCLSSQAVFFHRKDEYSQALTSYKEALSMYEKLFTTGNPDKANCMVLLAECYHESGDYTSAKKYYMAGLNEYLGIVSDNFPAMTENEKQYFWTSIEPYFERFKSFAVTNANADPSITAGLYNIQLRTKGILFSSAQKWKRRIIESNDPILVKQYNEWLRIKEGLCKQLMSGSGISSETGYDTLYNKACEIEKELAKRSSIFSGLVKKDETNWESIRDALKTDEAAVEIIRYNYFNKIATDSAIYAALIVYHDTRNYPEIVVLNSGNELEKKHIDKYLNYFNIDSKEFQSGNIDTLSYNAFWSPLSKKMRKVRRVYFSPEGAYYRINPSTLYDTERGLYLIDIQSIYNVTSTRDILHNRKKNIQSEKIAYLFGDPDNDLKPEARKRVLAGFQTRTSNYDCTRGRITSLEKSNQRNLYKRIPNAGFEADSIAVLMKHNGITPKVYKDSLALEDIVKSVNNPYVLHIAAHGCFDEVFSANSARNQTGSYESSLLKSIIIMAGANVSTEQIKARIQLDASIDDGLLTAFEAENLNLDSTELVVLSACKSGVGEIKSGEGVFGLQRAFLHAGAKAIIMSICNVNDLSSKDIMQEFYNNWLSGMPKREAFEKAQKSIKESTKYERMENRKPYYWGAFVMAGE